MMVAEDAAPSSGASSLQATPEMRRRAEQAMLSIGKELYPGRELIVSWDTDADAGDERKAGGGSDG